MEKVGVHRPKEVGAAEYKEYERSRHNVVRTQEMGPPERIFFSSHPRKRKCICIENAAHC